MGGGGSGLEGVRAYRCMVKLCDLLPIGPCCCIFDFTGSSERAMGAVAMSSMPGVVKRELMVSNQTRSFEDVGDHISQVDA